MKAVQIDRYGGPDVLQLREIPRPEPQPGEVLVRVHAASVNPVDWKLRKGMVWPIVRLKFPRVLGFDVAGEVVERGPRALRFQPGDEVFGMLPLESQGSYAEYVVAPEAAFAAKPRSLGFEEAAATPLAGLTAMQALRCQTSLAPGSDVLVNGGAGGVGTFAVQLAKAQGARVAATCSRKNLDLMQQLGADLALDYHQVDFLTRSERYDLVFDAVAKSSFSACRKVLKSGGVYVTTLPTAGIFAWSAALPLMGIFGCTKRACFILARSSQDDLAELGRLADDGRLKPIIDRTFVLDEIRAAHEFSESERARGKIVIRVAASP